MNKTTSFTRHQAVGAYRRWEPPDFDAPVPVPEPVPEPESTISPPPNAKAPQETASPLAEEEAAPSFPSPHLPTVEEIEQIHEEARRNGFEEGLADGRGQGYSDGRETGLREGREAGFLEGKAAAESEARQLHDLTVQLEQALAQFDAEIAEELVSLAVELARKIIQHTLAVEPEAIVSAIRAVLHTLPQARAQIHLNPDDIALAKSHLSEVLDQAEHVLVEDESISRGGCRIETPGAQIDATMETRWRRTIESLGREFTEWVPASDRRTKTRRTDDNEPADNPPATREPRKRAHPAKKSTHPDPVPVDAAPSAPPDTPPESSQ
ncbi:MAG: flagellar assembly protein FliH [Betaproteobacteria bacterium]|nr:flagellar assembly protein FliH [Betaproteobacteria bacterium]